MKPCFLYALQRKQYFAIIECRSTYKNAAVCQKIFKNLMSLFSIIYWGVNVFTRRKCVNMYWALIVNFKWVNHCFWVYIFMGFDFLYFFAFISPEKYLQIWWRSLLSTLGWIFVWLLSEGERKQMKFSLKRGTPRAEAPNVVKNKLLWGKTI